MAIEDQINPERRIFYIKALVLMWLLHMSPCTSSSAINPISCVTHLSSGSWNDLRYNIPSSRVYLRLYLCILLGIGGSLGNAQVLDKSKTS
ncbi:hypothetical protein LIER_39599 [Lithospermum erythrorhizon]|uniref:Uncharacterized protein n=1 Tax=Lithospermum erythrorhizon TaxID=34254 RepID=A0AAV3QHA7_LITER